MNRQEAVQASATPLGLPGTRPGLIRWDAIVGNNGSWEVARRVGFVREGTRRAVMIHRGVRKDMGVGSLWASEFREHQRA